MTDPRRLLEEGSDPCESLLLRSADCDTLSAEGRRRVMHGLSVAGALPGLAALGKGLAVQSGATKASFALTFKWVAVCVLAIAVPATVVRWGDRFTRHDSVAAAPPEMSPAPRAEKATSEDHNLPSDPSDISKAEEVPLPAIAPARSAARPSPSPSTLSDELIQLELVRSLIASRDAPGALRELDRYARRFPKGHLPQEAAVLRIEALSLKGNRAAAAALAQQLIASDPHSPYAARVRSVLAHSW